MKWAWLGGAAVLAILPFFLGNYGWYILSVTMV